MIPIKNAKEIEKMRQSCRTASEILDRVSELIRPGVTTKEVDEAAADFMNEAKVKSAFLGYRLGHRVFPGNICISLNDEVVHGIGSQRRIQYGDIVKLDIGVIQDGWVGDTAQTIPVGVCGRTYRSTCLRVTRKSAGARDQRRRRRRSTWATFARRSKMRRRRIISRSCASLLATGLGANCTKNRKFPITAGAEAVRN